MRGGGWDGNPQSSDIRQITLAGDGDFRSEECINLLNEADIVVTNPPFSLFREYIAQLVKHDKNFIVMGNMNSTSTKDIFPLFQDNRIWYGPSLQGTRIWFGVPDHYPLTGPDTEVRDGSKFVKTKGVIRWFTNLDHDERHKELHLYRSYEPDRYPKYLNHDAIEVSAVKEIPVDYTGVMGVPISFMDKYNPDQFEIVGIACRGKDVPLLRGEDGESKRVYSRILVRNRNPESST